MDDYFCDISSKTKAIFRKYLKKKSNVQITYVKNSKHEWVELRMG